MRWLVVAIDDTALWRPWGCSDLARKYLEDAFPSGPIINGCPLSGCPGVDDAPPFSKLSRVGRLRSLSAAQSGSIVAVDLDVLWGTLEQTKDFDGASGRLASATMPMELIGFPDVDFHPRALALLTVDGIAYGRMVSEGQDGSAIDTFMFNVREKMLHWLFRSSHDTICDRTWDTPDVCCLILPVIHRRPSSRVVILFSTHGGECFLETVHSVKLFALHSE